MSAIRAHVKLVILLSGMLLFLAACPDSVPPTAAFTVAPGSGRAPINIAFTDTSTVGSSALISWAWDFGDGKTSDLQNPVNTYISPGDYTATLTVKDESGLISSASAIVSVLNQSAGNNAPPVATEGASPEGEALEGEVEGEAEGQAEGEVATDGEMPGEDVLLKIVPTAMDFAHDLNRLEAQLTFEPFSASAGWRILNTNTWLEVSPREGDGGATLVLLLKRTNMGAGNVSGSFKVIGPKNTVDVFVTARQQAR